MEHQAGTPVLYINFLLVIYVTHCVFSLSVVSSSHRVYMVFLDGSAVKNPPAMQEIRVQLLGQEDPLEKEMTTHSSILAWEIPWTEEEPGRLQSLGPQELDTT